MTHPIEAWRREHAAFNRLLALLQQQVDAFHTGEPPDYQLMLDILAYLREFGDRSHHPREDEAFRRLVLHRPDRALPVARLQQEHRVIAHAGEQLRDLLEGALTDAIVQRAAIEVAAATYLVYYGNHIAREEEDVLPRAAALLSAEDWHAVRDAAPLLPDPVFGAGFDERFRALRARLDAPSVAR